MTAPSSTLAGWQATPFTGAGSTYDVYAKSPAGGGPGVVVIPEIPGMTPEVLALADHLVDAGFSVVIPSLFGAPGKSFSVGYLVSTAVRLCVSKEMKAFAAASERPISKFLRALAADLNARTPGKGVGVIGMCFTGGFALATAVDDSVMAAVMSQPGVPFPLGATRRADIGLSPTERATVVERTESGLCLMGLKFSEDKAVSATRFAAYADTFGDSIELIVLDSSTGNPDGYKSSAHSVLTGEVRENPPNSAYVTREKVVAFLRKSLAT
jgi:dienelactone hydrolase